MKYFDSTATTLPDEEIVKLYTKISTEYWYNSEALYLGGVKSHSLLEKSAKVICDTLEVCGKNVLFTSGATEANNTALFGICNNYNAPMHIITTKVEHASVLKAAKELERRGFEVTYLDINEDGIIDIEDLKKALKSTTVLVSIMWVNNIIGSIMPIKEVIEVLKNFPRAKLHVDMVQGIGKIKPDFDFNDIDLMTLSSHKLHGMKGCGVLVYNHSITINFLKGGHQQGGIRPGTVDLPGAVTCAKAIQLHGFYDDKKTIDISKKYDYLVSELSKLDTLVLNRSIHHASPYILSVSFKNLKGETALHALEKYDIYVGTGSACNSHSKDLEPTLLHFTKSEKLAINTIRISIDEKITYADLDELIQKIKEIGK